MSFKTKTVFLLLVLAAVFSGNARKLLNIASQAVESDVLAREPGEHGTGATCG